VVQGRVRIEYNIRRRVNRRRSWVQRFRGSRFRLGTGAKLKAEVLLNNAGFATSLTKTMFQTCPPSQSVKRGRRVCGDVEAVGFPVQNVYNMTCGDENTTFESR